MNILGKILEAVLKPKFEKEANKIINSEEVQSNLKVISHSTNEIIRLTAELKEKQKEYDKQIKKFQKDGIKVKTGATPTQMQTAFEEWQKKQHEEYFKKHPEAINNPLIKKMLDYKL
jgi:hypothetical protein